MRMANPLWQRTLRTNDRIPAELKTPRHEPGPEHAILNTRLYLVSIFNTVIPAQAGIPAA